MHTPIEITRAARVAMGTLAVLVLSACGQETTMTPPTNGAADFGLSSTGLAYPETTRGDVVEALHGVEVADPYRWLEDLDADETAAWVAAQNEVTFSYLSKIEGRDEIRARLEGLWDHERLDVPYIEGGRTFFRRNDGLQNQSVLYVVDAEGAEPRELLDPNGLSTDGTIAVGATSVSPDGKLLVYAVQESGSDWIEWHVRDVTTGKDLPDVVKWSKFSDAAWSRDSAGFFYARYDAPEEGKEFEGANYFQRLHYHKLGDAQSADRLVHQDKENKEWGFDGRETLDGRYLVISVWQGTERKNRIWITDPAGGVAMIKLLDAGDAQYEFLGSFGDDIWFKTDNGADRGRVIVVDAKDPAPERWRTVIAEAAENLREVHLVGDAVFCLYLKDARSLVKVFDREGQHLRDVDLPGIGTAWGFEGKPGDAVTYYAFSGYTTPTTVYRYDVASGESTLYRATDMDFDPSGYVTKQVFFPSKDGTQIPMFLTHKKGLGLDGSNPTYLYGYGGFNIPLTPFFSISNVVWMEMGGVFAVANLRGGGEYGEDWHAAGTKDQKQNVFDDFIGAAEWLIDEGYTSTPKLAIAGGSNGGLLVGACMTQRPDLFGACLPAVGVMDMLRFHKFTIGWAWVSDYGDPDDAAEFPALHAYSPLHNLKAGVAYPPTLVTTGDHDDRVVPSHSFKFASELQHVQSGDNPCLIRVEVRAGHGAGKPTSKVIDEIADKWAFLKHVLGM